MVKCFNYWISTKFLLCILIVWCPHFSFSQKGYLVGDKISSFTLVNAIDDSNTALSDYAHEKAITIIFTNNSCPYARLYEDRILKLASEFKSKNIPFILINPGNEAGAVEDAPPALRSRATLKKYTFPYLIDPKREIARQFGASKTPESFVLKNMNGSFVLVYRGAIDDNPQVAADVTQGYLKDALDAIVNGGSIKLKEKRPSGCMIP
jgi:peroxiredoxin